MTNAACTPLLQAPRRLFRPPLAVAGRPFASREEAMADRSAARRYLARQAPGWVLVALVVEPADDGPEAARR